ncbi:hypothetical protein [Rhizobium sp. ZW T2_16]|uniref:hypothetical protein n=1 Tax=Rhizobium sp. ZW T2_16 TaxID=3378083 RepID=UPI003854F9E8
MTKLANERSLTTEELVRDGVSGALKIFQNEGTRLEDRIRVADTQKGYLLALSAALVKQIEVSDEFKKQFYDVMAEKNITVPKSGKTGAPANEYLYYLRTLFGEEKDKKWVPNRTYENWARPLRYLVSLDVTEVSEFRDKIDTAEAVKGSKTLRRIEALRTLDMVDTTHKGRTGKISGSAEIPLSLLRVKPVATLKVAPDTIHLNEDHIGLAIVHYRDGGLHLLFGSNDEDEIKRIAVASYSAQKERLHAAAKESSPESGPATAGSADDEMRAA